MKYLNQIWAVAKRECKILYVNRIYFYSMVVFPLLAMIFFTTLMDDGIPQEMPVGVVDLDNTTMTRALGRKLDGFQNSRVIARYPSVAEARKAMQENEIYGFLYLPKGTTDKLLASRRPTISFFYSQTSLTAGSMVMKDLKTTATLAAMGVGGDGRRSGHDAGQGSHRPPDGHALATHPPRPPSGGQPLGQL